MLKIAVIGVGRMGMRHAYNLYHGFLAGAKLTAVCDIDKEVLDKCAVRFKKAARFSSVDEMLSAQKPDAVIIATPHYAHGEIAIKCIKAGVHTLVEKPLTVTAAESKEVIECAAANPQVKVGVSFNQRSNRMYKRVKALMDERALGEIQRVNFIITDWYRSQAYYNQGGWRASYNGEGGGCLINQCVHQLDILQWLTGMPTTVFAKCETIDRDITTENDVTAILTYADGYKCSFTASTHEIKGTNRLEIACDKGKVVIGSMRAVVYRHKSQKAVNSETEKGYGFAKSSKKVYRYGFFTLLADIIFGQQLRSVRAFAKELKGKGKMLAPVADGLNAVRLINGLYTSSWKGAPVALPVDDAEYIAALDERRKEELKK